ncbi:MAG: L-lactate permease, partial [Dethiobacter sp.]|nr:L-lactate permease [Dethiobacter sp.]
MSLSALALLAFLPILLTIVLMGGFLWPAKKSMPVAWLLTATMALAVWQVEPVRVLASAMQGVLLSLDILIILFGALLVLNIMQSSGAMSVINQSLRKVTADRR